MIMDLKIFLGIAIDGSNDIEKPHSKIALIKKVGKVSVLADYIKGSKKNNKIPSIFQIILRI